jgi:hypothetical protein
VAASVIPPVCQMFDSKLGALFQVLATERFFNVHPFNPFAFLRQFESFPNIVSLTVLLFQAWYSRVVANFRFWTNVPLVIVRHYHRFVFRHPLKLSQAYVSIPVRIFPVSHSKVAVKHLCLPTAPFLVVGH